jgi:hypothetical protein
MSTAWTNTCAVPYLVVHNALTPCTAAPYLLEWVWYHYLLGFEHFYFYNNDSEVCHLMIARQCAFVTYLFDHRHRTTPCRCSRRSSIRAWLL